MSLLALTSELGRLAAEALVAAASSPEQASRIPAELPVVKSSKAGFGDFQISACLQLGKALGQPARELAAIVEQALRPHPSLSRVEVAGPGFVNLHVTDEFLARATEALGRDPGLGLRPVGAGQRVVIDFSSPNVARPMHIAHIRSTIIGDALRRTLAALGWEVIADNHLGDWGTQFGKLIVAYRRWLDPDAYAADAVAELLRLYSTFHAEEARQRAELGLETPARRAAAQAGEGEAEGDEADEATTDARVTPLLEEARRELVKLQAGDPDNTALWNQFIVDSRHVFERVLDRLDVRFDFWLGESAYHAMLPRVVEDLTERGIAVPSRGAKVVFLDEEKLTPYIVQKADGGFNYATSDIAAMAVRTGTPPWSDVPAGPFNAQRVIIVTDERQQLHFKQLFAVARRLGVTAQLEHVWFGLMRLPEGTIKTREAGSKMIFLTDLLDEAERRAYAVAADKAREPAREGSSQREAEEPLTEEELRNVARVVGIGAVKYNDLSRDRQTLVTFTWDKALSLSGNTAPYLQYAYARIRSIVRKGQRQLETHMGAPDSEGATGTGAAATILLGTPVERDLAQRLLRWPEAVEDVGRTLRPHLLADYLFELATAFSTFYADHPVLKAEPAVRASRLLLTDLVARVLATGLGLLGIEVLERM